MAVTTARVDAPAERVWAVLADGWSYPGWVVGASHMRAVDASWPAPGAQLHHAVGAWPLVVRDTTQVLAVQPGRRLLLRARGWPVGEADVELTLTPASAGDDPAGATQVLMREEPVSGPFHRLRNPAFDWLIHRRNLESLGRLRALAQRPAQP